MISQDEEARLNEEEEEVLIIPFPQVTRTDDAEDGTGTDYFCGMIGWHIPFIFFLNNNTFFIMHVQ